MADEVVLKAVFDTTGVEAGIAKAKRAFDSLTASADRSAFKLKGVGQQVSEIGLALGGPLGTQVTALGSAVNTAGESFLTLTGHVGNFGAALLGLGGGLAVVTAGMVAMAKQGGDLAGRVVDVADSLELSVQQVQVLDIELRQTGSNIEAARGGIARFEGVLAQVAAGSAPRAAAVLKRLGIDAREAALSPGEAFLELGRILGGVENQAERLALAKELLGKSAANLLPALIAAANASKDLGDNAKYAGLILGEDVLRNADNVGDAFTRLGIAFDNVKIRIANEIAPEIVKSLEDIQGASSETGQAISAAGFIASKGLLVLQETLRMIKQDIDDVTTVAQRVGSRVGLYDPTKNLPGIPDLTAKSKEAIEALKLEERIRQKAAQNLTGLGKTGTGKKGKSDAQREAEREAKEAQREAEAFARNQQRAVNELIAAEERARVTASQNTLQAMLSNFAAEREAVESLEQFKTITAREASDERVRIAQREMEERLRSIAQQIAETETVSQGGAGQSLQIQVEIQKNIARRVELEKESVAVADAYLRVLSRATIETNAQTEAIRQQQLAFADVGQVVVKNPLVAAGREFTEEQIQKGAEAFDRAERNRKIFQRGVEDLSDDLGRMLTQPWRLFEDGARSALGNVLSVFANTLSQMAAQVVSSGLLNLLTSLIGGIGGAFGGSLVSSVGGLPKINLDLFKKIPLAGFRAAGGPVLTKRTYLVGERGPELFIPKSLARSAPGKDLSAVLRRRGRRDLNDLPKPEELNLALKGRAPEATAKTTAKAGGAARGRAVIGASGPELFVPREPGYVVPTKKAKEWLTPEDLSFFRRSSTAGLRARGGPVRAGHTYVVGEEEPEFYVPYREGRRAKRLPDDKPLGSTGKGGREVGETARQAAVTLGSTGQGGREVGEKAAKTAIRERGPIVLTNMPTPPEININLTDKPASSRGAGAAAGGRQLLGARGPEIFVPPKHGYVIPASKAREWLTDEDLALLKRFPLAGARAGGGPVFPGRSFLVGEKGPELFTPKQSGQITSAKETSAGRTITINITVPSPESARDQRTQAQVLNAVRRGMAQASRGDV